LGFTLFRLVADHADVFAALPSNLHEALLREYISGASGPGLRPDVLDRLAEPWLGDGQAAFYRQIAQADEQFTANVELHFGDIDVPTLIVWGTDDEWIPVDRAHRLASVNPGSSLELIEGGGHILQEDRPTELNEILRRWLGS
jgi:pimeloyl-ACP methyl ester carboxylesterase